MVQLIIMLCVALGDSLTNFILPSVSADTSLVGVSPKQSERDGISLVLIPITSGAHSERRVSGYTIVLDDDFTRSFLMRLPWHRDDYGYPRTNLPYDGKHLTPIRMHTLVYDQYNGPMCSRLKIDHIDRNPLNNQPSNLRLVSQTVNCANRDRSPANTSGFTGVYLNSRAKPGSLAPWVAQINLRGTRKRMHIGVFPDKLSAARAVNAAYRIQYPEVTIPNPEAEL